MPPPAAPWDVNSDGTVNILDLVAVAGQFGQSGDDLDGDVNGDSTVNILDLVTVAGHFGETIPAAPENVASTLNARNYSQARILSILV